MKLLPAPHGGTRQRSPSIRREWIEIEIRTVEKNGEPWSPSIRREWIEIFFHAPKAYKGLNVSLHTEGVD